MSKIVLTLNKSPSLVPQTNEVQESNKRGDHKVDRQRVVPQICREIALQNVPSAKSFSIISGVYQLFEGFLLYVAGLSIILLQPTSSIDPRFMHIVLIAIPFAYIVLAKHWHLYTMWAFRRSAIPLLRAGIGLSLIFAIYFTALTLIGQGKETLPSWFKLWFLAGIAMLMLGRIILKAKVTNWLKTGELQRRAVIVGAGEHAYSLIQQLKNQQGDEVNILGIFDDRFDERTPDLIDGIHKLGNIDDLVEFSRMTRVDVAIVTLPITAENRLIIMMKKLWVLPIDIRLAAHSSKIHFSKRAYSYMGDAALLDVFDKPLSDWDRVYKNIFDRTIGLFALIALSPLMLITAILIKLDSKGPVFFKQRRHGFNNEIIEVYKFRSMYTHKTDNGGLKQVTKGDPRVTRIGAFIRKTSIDELPQLFNVVFKGNLSLVGPRPHSIAQKFFAETADGYFARHKMKPGITGWAQINGWRGETDTDEKIQKRVEFDLYYIENWSLWMDFKILLKTPVSLVTKNEGAY